MLQARARASRAHTHTHIHTRTYTHARAHIAYTPFHFRLCSNDLPFPPPGVNAHLTRPHHRASVLRRANHYQPLPSRSRCTPQADHRPAHLHDPRHYHSHFYCNSRTLTQSHTHDFIDERHTRAPRAPREHHQRHHQLPPRRVHRSCLRMSRQSHRRRSSALPSRVRHRHSRAV